MPIEFFLLGFLTPLLPALGQPFLLIFFICILLLHFYRHRQPIYESLWLWPFLSVLFAWIAAEVYCEFDYQSLSQALTSQQDFISFINAQFMSPPDWLRALGVFLRWMGFSILLANLSRVEGHRLQFGRGLVCGIVPALILVWAEWLLWPQIHLPYRNDFWIGVDRFAGPLSDPNALGILLALLFPWFLSRCSLRSPLNILLIIGAVLAALASGSRSFFLALMLYAAFATWRRDKKLFAAGALLSVTVFISLNLFEIASFSSVSGINRLWNALQWHHLDETLFSRRVFWMIDLAAWQDHLVFGVGLEKFRYLVGWYAELLDFNIGVWTDNPNNFYLGLLAELGIVGAVAGVISLRSCQMRISSPLWARCSAAVLLVLLLTGPHLDFVEITIASAWVFSHVITIRVARYNRVVLCSLFAAIVSIFLLKYTGTYGLYPQEGEGTDAFRWTKARAQFLVRCFGSEVEFGLRAVHPDLGTAPITVEVFAPDEQHVLLLKDFTYEYVRVRCETGDRKRSIVPIQIAVSRIWRPAEYGQSADWRALGLQLRLNNSAVVIE